MTAFWTFAIALGTFFLALIAFIQLKRANIISNADFLLKLNRDFFTNGNNQGIIIAIEEKQNLLKRNGGNFTEYQLDDYLGTFELMTWYEEKKLIDFERIDDTFGHYVSLAWKNKEVNDYIIELRKQYNDPRYYESFEKLADRIIEKENEIRATEVEMKTIKKVILVTLISFVFVTSTVFATDVMEADGTDWQGSLYPHIDKATRDLANSTYIMGFLTGISTVYKNASALLGYVSGVEETTEKDTQERELIKTYADDTKEQIEKVGVFGGTTVDQIRKGVDTFYNDFANQKIRIVDAIYVVKMQITGEDPDSINAQIRYLKMQPIDEASLGRGFREYLLFITGENRIKITSQELQRMKDWHPEENRVSATPEEFQRIKEGKIDEEALFKAGFFRGKNGSFHYLFCYGIYK